jgi:hypothetical protein
MYPCDCQGCPSRFNQAGVVATTDEQAASMHKKGWGCGRPECCTLTFWQEQSGGIEIHDWPSPGSPLFEAGRRGTMAIHRRSSLHVVQEPPDEAEAVRRLLELVGKRPAMKDRFTITGGSIKWWEGYGNRPGLRVTIEGQFPRLDEFRFRRKGRLWYAELDGAACYFAWGGPGNEGGFGGNQYDIEMQNEADIPPDVKHEGPKLTLLGPWSSGTSATTTTSRGPSGEPSRAHSAR